MEIHIKNKLQDVERLFGITIKSEKLGIPYKRFNQTLIRADKPIMDIYASTLKNSELQFFVNKNVKAWVVYILNSFLKKKKQPLKNLLGIKRVWRFLEVIDMPLHADIVYFRQRAVVMVYSKEKRVVKVALTQ